MKRNQKFRFVLGTVFGVLLVPGFALAQSPFHRINPIPITSCTSPFFANIPGAYYLVTANLTTSGSCIVVTAANVTIDLGGHTLTGVASTGGGVLILAGADGAVVKNGTVAKFSVGVEVNGNNDANLSALTATENGFGVDFFFTQGGMLLTSQISGNATHGVEIAGSQNIRVVNNAITNNGIDGILVVDSSGNTISFNSSVSLNGYAGILVANDATLGNPPPTPASCTPVTSPSQNNLIFSNTGSGNAVLGIGLQCGVALSNTVSENAMSGGTWGGYDGNLNCDANSWSFDVFNLQGGAINPLKVTGGAISPLA